MSCENQILSFITEAFLLGDGAGIQPTQSLLGSGVIDSTGVLELVLFIEKTFGIQVADEEMIPSNMDSIRHIADYVRRKQASADVSTDEPCQPECGEQQAVPRP
ncbi:MAG: acyl carrier protein [Phycisphaerae bacterium]|nr:acyl carrier protein [Phycisphaerae bacterium]